MKGRHYQTSFDALFGFLMDGVLLTNKQSLFSVKGKMDYRFFKILGINSCFLIIIWDFIPKLLMIIRKIGPQWLSKSISPNPFWPRQQKGIDFIEEEDGTSIT